MKMQSIFQSADSGPALARMPLFDAKFERQMVLWAKLSANVRAATSSLALTGDILYQPPSHSHWGGTELSGTRDYTPTDSWTSVDWNLCARMDELVVREYKQSARQFCRIMVDCSASMRLKGPKAQSSRFDLAVRLAAILGYTALSRNQQVTFYGFDDSFHAMNQSMGATCDIGHGLKFLQQLIDTRSATKTLFSKSVESLIRKESTRGLVIVLTDMFDDSFPRGLGLLRNAGYTPRILRLYSDHDMGVGLYGDVQIIDAETGRTFEVTITPSQLKYFQKKFQAHTEKVRAWCEKYNARFQNVYCDLPTHQACLQALGLKNS